MKKARFEKTKAKFSKITDGLGTPIDRRVLPAVVYLNLLGFPTWNSCAGHFSKTRANMPIISVQAKGKPRYRFVGEARIVANLLKKYSLPSWRDIFDRGPIEEEYWRQTSGLRTPHAFADWEELNRELIDDAQTLIAEFNYNSLCKLEISRGGDIIFLRKDRRNLNRRTFPRAYKIARQAFSDFSRFLRDKYYSS